MACADLSLVRRAVAGEAGALDLLVQALRPHIERQLQRYPVSDEDRRDLLQTTLIQITRRLGSFRGDASFSTWLYRVTANEALMVMRSQRRHRARHVEGMDLEELGSFPLSHMAEVPDLVEARAANNERDEQVRHALSELTENERNVVVLYYHFDLGLDEIAAQLDTSPSAVRSRLHRARIRLRALLESTPLADEFREGGQAAMKASVLAKRRMRMPHSLSSAPAEAPLVA
ncbi:RNA polymerase sigma factor [Pendulispora albinea]|uniref:Sigma-70 family RNA polymerase sigma factor n=1 Tax=Pendulispora albinea TaxID=2741071 RepID=A0ABZ2LYJ9_9BACT